MNRTPIIRLALALIILPFAVGCLGVQEPQAQDYGYAQPYEQPFAGYSREELAQMLAPIALYPDPLLSQILMASTYPVEVMEADRWLRENPGLQGNVLDAALLDTDWDPSIMALCHFPFILARMSERIDATTDLGNAFLVQEAEVMDMVQELRAHAFAQGNLASSSQQQVIVQQQTIFIAPADPRVIFVPYYDPFSIYGSWWYPAYPPHAWAPPGTRIGFGISYWSGSYFEFSFGSWSFFDWPRHSIFIDVHKRPRYVRHDRWFDKPGRWNHSPRHRKGVAYRDRDNRREENSRPRHDKDFRRADRDIPKRVTEPRKMVLDGDRRVEMPTGTDRSNRGDDGPRVNRNRGDRDRTERDRLEQANLESERQESERLEQARLENESLNRERAERERREQVRIEQERQNREQQERARIERERQGRERAERNRQEQAKIVRERQEKVQVEQKRQEQVRAQRERQERAQAERARQEQAKVERERRQRAKKVEQDRQVGGRAEQQRQGQARAEQARQNQVRTERIRKETVTVERVKTGNNSPQRVKVERTVQKRVRVERAPKSNGAGKVIRQAKEERKENPSVRQSRTGQENRSDASQDRGRPEDGDKENRNNNWGRNRR